jgi:hypothetical protein
MRRVPVIGKRAFFPAAEPNAPGGGSLLLAQIAVRSIFIFTGNVVQRQII